MTEEKIKCKNCEAEILVATARRTNGRCMPCYRGRLSKRLIHNVFGGLLFAIVLLFITPLSLIARLFKKDVWKGEWISDWLTERISIEVAEKKYAFEPGNQKWINFKQKFQEGYEVWEFNSPPETWEKLAGRSGVCLISNGKIIDSIILMMN